MKKIVLMVVIFCMGGVASFFALDANAVEFSFDGENTGISFQEMMSDKNDSIEILPVVSKENNIVNNTEDIKSVSIDTSEDGNSQEVLRKVDFNKATQWYDHVPDYYRRDDGSACAWVAVKDQKKRWIETNLINKVVDREKDDYYVCEFLQTWINRWSNCRETNPHTNPGKYSCEVSWGSLSEKNTGKCKWKSKWEWENGY